MAVIAALGFMTMPNAGSSAAPVVPSLGVAQDVAIVQIAGGCGRGWHPDRWGQCVPNRYSYDRPNWRPYGPYYTGHGIGRHRAIMAQRTTWIANNSGGRKATELVKAIRAKEKFRLKVCYRRTAEV